MSFVDSVMRNYFQSQRCHAVIFLCLGMPDDSRVCLGDVIVDINCRRRELWRHAALLVGVGGLKKACYVSLRCYVTGRRPGFFSCDAILAQRVIHGPEQAVEEHGMCCIRGAEYLVCGLRGGQVRDR